MIKEKVPVFLTVGNKKQKELCEKLLSVYFGCAGGGIKKHFGSFVVI